MFTIEINPCPTLPLRPHRPNKRRVDVDRHRSLAPLACALADQFTLELGRLPRGPSHTADRPKRNSCSNRAGGTSGIKGVPPPRRAAGKILLPAMLLDRPENLILRRPFTV